MSQVLMPKATAVWLIENTALTFDQISDFCGLHSLEVQSIADGEASIGMVGYDPITNGQLTKEEIDRCGADPEARLQLAETNIPRPKIRTKGPRYTPVTRRQDRPDAIAWLVKNFPQLSDGQISKLLGTTKPTINGVRDRTHWNINNIKPRDPVALGLVAREDLTAAIEKANRATERAEKRKNKEKEQSSTQIEAVEIENTDTVSLPSAEPEILNKNVELTGSDEKENTSSENSDNPFAALGQLLPQKKESETKDPSEEQ